MNETEYSMEKIDKADLDRLASLAERNRNAFFARRGRWGIYQDRIVAVALCQGAALHFVDGKSGVKDFDVWTFYAKHPEGPFPSRVVNHEDFGESKFGRNPNIPARTFLRSAIQHTDSHAAGCATHTRAAASAIAVSAPSRSPKAGRRDPGPGA